METSRTESILGVVRAIISAETGVRQEEIKADTRFVTVVTDSLEMLSLVIAIEGEFAVEIPSGELKKLLTVQDVVNYVEARK